MKKLILLFTVCLFATASFAQRIDWGIKGGLNLATLTQNSDAKMKPSIYVGAFAEFQILDFLSIQPEVIYSRQGAKSSFDVAGVDTDTWTRMNYLNIPILAKLYVFDNLSLDLGPQFGILLNARAKVKVNGDSSTSKLDDFKNFDVSFPVGLSYRITRRWDVSARYNIGLTKVHDDQDWKNGVLQLGAGFRF